MGFVGGYNGQLFQSLITHPGHHPGPLPRCGGRPAAASTSGTGRQTRAPSFWSLATPSPKRSWSASWRTTKASWGRRKWWPISGSMPKGVPGDFYATLCRLAKAQGKKVIVDSSGSALREALPGGPDLVKPNDEELCQLTGQDTSTVEGCIPGGPKPGGRWAPGPWLCPRGRTACWWSPPRGCTRAGRPASRW